MQGLSEVWKSCTTAHPAASAGWLAVLILMQPADGADPAYIAVAGLILHLALNFSWRKLESPISRGIAILIAFAVLAGLLGPATGWLPAAAASAVLMVLQVTTLLAESQPDAASPIAAPPEANLEPLSTLPRWMSEFADTYGMPTHLRTSRNYIEICNDNHSSYVRLSLTSAAQQIPKDLGLRVHKEFYVFRTAVRRNLRENGRHFLEINESTRIPVGRSFLSAAKAEGLIN